jgi:hypothetical protein
MHRFLTLIVALFALLISLQAAFAAGLFPGYAGNPWGTSSHKIIKDYLKGQMGQVGELVTYQQKNPNKEIRQRTFAFKDNKLNAVTVSFNADYIKKEGIEKLLAKHKKAYGEGTMDRSKAPHLITYLWEDAKTRITFAYAPKRPDLTILMFQQK